jgi:hypothetical protein
MTNEELKHILEGILNDAVTLQVYFILKSQNSLTIKLADIDNGETLQGLRTLYVDKIEEDIIRNEQLNNIRVIGIDERANAIYHL